MMMEECLLSLCVVLLKKMDIVLKIQKGGQRGSTFIPLML